MLLTKEQVHKVEENMGLVHSVIQTKLHPPFQVGMYSYEDFFQIGSIGLCKAVAADQGGTFSTFAYRLIWNEICDALIYATRRQEKETVCDVTPYIPAKQEKTSEQMELMLDLEQVLNEAKKKAPPSTVKGMDAIKMIAAGYTSREIGEQMGASDKLVCAWISKARKFLKENPEIKILAEGYPIAR